MHKDVKREIRKLKSQGKTITEISRKTGYARSTVYYHCNNKYKKHILIKSKQYLDKTPLCSKVRSFNSAGPKKPDRSIKNRSRVTMKEIINKYGTKTSCYLTGDKIDLSNPASYSFDHVIPVAKGGKNIIDNLGVCTQEVNIAKNDKTPQEFFELCIKVLRYNGYKVTKNGSSGRT